VQHLHLCFGDSLFYHSLISPVYVGHETQQKQHPSAALWWLQWSVPNECWQPRNVLAIFLIFVCRASTVLWFPYICLHALTPQTLPWMSLPHDKLLRMCMDCNVHLQMQMGTENSVEKQKERNGRKGRGQRKEGI
jgi:hypothetical protein